MPSPTRRMFKTDPVLTTFAQNWHQDESKATYRSFSTTQPVQEQSGKYREYDLGDLLRDDARAVGPGAPAPLTGQGQTKNTYDCEVVELGVAITEQDVANARSDIDLDRDAVHLIQQKMAISLEKKAMNTLINAVGVWDNEVTVGATKWSAGGATPIQDMQNAMVQMESETSLMPNWGFGSRRAIMALLQRDDVKDVIKSTEDKIPTIALLAKAIGLAGITVGSMVENRAAQGVADDIGFIAPDSFLLYHLAPSGASDRTPTAVKTFVWSNLTKMNDLGVRMRRYEEPKNKIEVIEGQYACDLKITGSMLGYRFDAVL